MIRLNCQPASPIELVYNKTHFTFTYQPRSHLVHNGQLGILPSLLLPSPLSSTPLLLCSLSSQLTKLTNPAPGIKAFPIPKSSRRVNIEALWKEDPEWGRTNRDRMVRNVKLPFRVWFMRNLGEGREGGKYRTLFVEKGEEWEGQ